MYFGSLWAPYLQSPEWRLIDSRLSVPSLINWMTGWLNLLRRLHILFWSLKRYEDSSFLKPWCDEGCNGNILGPEGTVCVSQYRDDCRCPWEAQPTEPSKLGWGRAGPQAGYNGAMSHSSGVFRWQLLLLGCCERLSALWRWFQFCHIFYSALFIPSGLRGNAKTEGENTER